MIESNTKANALKRRRTRKVGRFFAWFFGTMLLLAFVGLLVSVIVYPFVVRYEEKEAEKQKQIELEYKILHRRF